MTESHRATAADVYRVIKVDVLRGAFLAGERLDPKSLAEQTASSSSTVHIVLGRLASEHLIVWLPGEGFHMPFLTEAALRGSYRWIHALAVVALDLALEDPAVAFPDPEPSGSLADDDPDVHAIERFFEALAALSESAEIKIAVRQANDRLHAPRRFKARVLPDGRQEIDELAMLLRSGQYDCLRVGLARYRDRRLACVPELVRLRHRVRYVSTPVQTAGWL